MAQERVGLREERQKREREEREREERERREREREGEKGEGGRESAFSRGGRSRPAAVVLPHGGGMWVGR